MTLGHYTITLPIYAANEQEAQTLEADFKEFMRQKYNQGIYPRAATLSRILNQYGNNIMVNAALKI